mgnify:CR=1 FL=1
MKLQDIGNMAYYWRNRYDPESANAFSEILWRLLLLISLVIIIGASTYTVFALTSNSITGQDSPTVGQGETLSREALHNTLGLFEQRQERFRFVQNNPPNIPDPSR